MRFEIPPHEIIFESIGSILERVYGPASEIVLGMFSDATWFSPEPFNLTEEKKRELEDRFTYCVTEAAMKDSLSGLKAFLTDTSDKLKTSYEELKKDGWQWLQSFTCDDKDSFRHFANYLAHATIFGIDAENFYRKFTNTRKHGRRMYDANGAPILHKLYEYSPVSTPEYVPDMFDTDEYGEEYEKVAGLFSDIMNTLWDTYRYVVSVDTMALMIKNRPEKCLSCLMACVKEAMDELKKGHIDPEKTTPTEADFQEALQMLPRHFTEKILKKSLPELSTDLYHEVKDIYKKAFAIIVQRRITQQQGLSDTEDKVFGHIGDPADRFRKATHAKLLLRNIKEFERLDADGGNVGKKIRKGTIACLFYKWTGTEMPAKPFLSDYYCHVCDDKEYHVAQSTFSTALSGLPVRSPLCEAFDKKAEEIIRRDESPTTLTIVSTTEREDIQNEPQQTHTEASARKLLEKQPSSVNLH